MRKILGCILLSISISAFAAKAKPEIFYWKIERVIDGDTIAVQVDGMPADLKLKVRAMGIDTPEKGGRAKCDQEALLGAQATKTTKELIAGAKKVGFSDVKWDKFGGRVDAKVIIDGVDLAETLIAKGLAKPYFGEKKSSWCN